MPYLILKILVVSYLILRILSLWPLPLLSNKLALAVICLLNLYKILFLLSYKVIDAVSNGVIISVTKPYSIAVLVSTSKVTSLRFIRS